MIKRLRVKFVCITMTLLMAMLICIIVFVLSSTAKGLESESLNILRDASDEHMRPGKPGHISQPVFVIREDRREGLAVIGSDYYDLTDHSLLGQIYEAAEDQNTEHGVLKAYNLRFLRLEGPLGDGYAFTDISGEQIALRNLLCNCIWIGALGTVGFLLISILLAYWIVKPVEKAWQQQRQFVADASHELKTPLTVILTNAELLQSPEYDEEAKSRFSDSILAMTRQMRRLVEDLLQLARGDNGQIGINFTAIDLSRLTEESILPFEPVYFEEGLTLESRIQPGLRVNGDGQYLRQVMEILLDNGRKYSAPGGKCVLTLTGVAGRKVQLQFFTPGVPLTDQQCRDIFKRFYRVDEARTGGSYGLGLSIAQRIVAEHGGKIWANGISGGNRFTVILPEG